MATKYHNIKTEIVDDQIFIISINRPEKRNAIDVHTAKELLSTFQDFESNLKLKIMILRGEGGNFCAGADLDALSKGSGNEINIDMGNIAPLGPSRMLLSKPTIAAVEGFAVAGGLELSLLMDLRICNAKSTFGVFCRRFGVPLIDGGTVRLPRLIGMSRALDMILTGRPVNGIEAFQIGLANRLEENVFDGALKLARELCQFPFECMKNDRLSCYEQHSLSVKEALKNEFKHGLKSLSTGDFLYGSKSFVEGRGKHGNFKVMNSRL